MISEDLHTQRSIFLVDKNLVPEKFKEYCIVFFHFSRANDVICHLS